jgi:hypothetical protein
MLAFETAFGFFCRIAGRGGRLENRICLHCEFEFSPISTASPNYTILQHWEHGKVRKAVRRETLRRARESQTKE